MSTTDYLERIPAISIHPDSASREDVAQLAADVMHLRACVLRALGALTSDYLTAGEIEHLREVLREALE